MANTEIRKDGLVLLRDTDRNPQVLFIETIYQGELTKDNPRAVIIPNVGDMVIDRSQGYPRFLEVTFVDEIDLLPTLEEAIQPSKNEFTKNTKLLGVGPGYQSETWRLFVDRGVVPHVILPDSRLHIKGKENTKYKVFLGTDVSKATGKVISMNFNANGELLSEDIPLEKVAFASGGTVDTNIAVKVPRKGYTNHALENGDVVTLVTYNEEGQASSYNTLLVHNTTLDRSIESSTKYVTSISIDSPFLDKTENNVLVFPTNTPRDALAMMGVVHYSDGTSKKMVIDGKRMVLSGFDNYVPMKSAQLIQLVLTYHLPNGEMALNSSMGDSPFISVKYFARTKPVDGSYSVNLFPIPTYVSDVYGWRLRYFLYTLDRDISYEVTNLVRPGANMKPYDPMLYGEIQDVTVSLDLKEVDPRLKQFIHVQTFKVALMGKPTVGNYSPWFITYEKDQPEPYGANIVCKAVHDPGLNRTRMDISCGADTEAAWLDRVYYRTMPLFDKYSETRPPKPTHFTLIINDTQVSYPLRAWNAVLDFPVKATDGYGVVIQFSRLDGNTELQLGASPMCYMDISEGGALDHATTLVVPGNSGSSTAETIIDIDVEVQRIIDRGASDPVIAKYRELLERIKRYSLLRYAAINEIYQRIRKTDLTPASIANDVILLEVEVNKISISDFNRDLTSDGTAPSMERQR